MLSNLSHVKTRVPVEGPCICDHVGVLLLQEISNLKLSIARETIPSQAGEGAATAPSPGTPPVTSPSVPPELRIPPRLLRIPPVLNH